MNTAELKSYGPHARRTFIEAVTAQAARFGIRADGSDPAKVQGDVLLVSGQAYPKSVAAPRKALVDRIAADGFEATIESVAYTWFNRLAAIRYMELHGYLEHGYRVLSHPEGKGVPEILDHAADVELPGLDRDRAIELKLDGTKDEELFRLLLLAQCNALHRAMPFLFEAIGHETELLLPANLLHTDSLIRQMVEQVDQELWQDIEIIGWLYQFYISEKKDEVIGKVVKSEDIPAATQLFTPNWIVKYLVQNSLGAQWLATYPESPLKAQMKYYIEPAEQTEEVNAQLTEITPTELDPEELTLIDPACGSGHILVEAYELFKAIYLERGYLQRDVPRLILEKNLFGLDIDERAAQLSGFALMMKGRADDRDLFEREVELKVMALVDSVGFEAEVLAKGVELSGFGVSVSDLMEVWRLFEHATTFGALIRVPEELAEKLPALRELSARTSEDLFVAKAITHLRRLLRQAEVLAAEYGTVVANPPYMGSNSMSARVKGFVRDQFPEGRADLYGCFITRGCHLATGGGYASMVTRQGWMFQSSFRSMRERMMREKTLTSMAHLGSRAFGSISGEVVSTTMFTIRNRRSDGYRPVFFRLTDGNEEAKRRTLVNRGERFGRMAQEDFSKIPGAPIAYWVGAGFLKTFEDEPPLSSLISINAGLSTGNNELFQRHWHEVAFPRIAFMYPEHPNRWVPCNSGGPYRKWFGNNGVLVDWENDGAAIREHRNAKGNIASVIRNEEHYFKEGVTWNKITTGQFAARWMDRGFAFDDTGRSGFLVEASTFPENVLAAMVSNFANVALGALTPGMSITSGELAKLPIAGRDDHRIRKAASAAVADARRDWDAYERSWSFRSTPLLERSYASELTVEASYAAWITQNRETIAEMRRLEIENNRLLNDAYGVHDEVSPSVPVEQITLTVNPAYRYGTKLTSEEQWTRFREDTMEELVSYAIGCMMGRYSLDAPGLIYAHNGNEGFDPSRYATYPADDDGIVPLTRTEWFEDDAANRVVEFLSVAWDPAHLEENLTFLADNLGPRKNESSRETIRRFLCDKFFKNHHLKRYKKRPIYWLFSSGKQKAFQCLVYLHRYNEGTLARMRSEYVIPLQGKMAARIEQLSADVEAATSSAHRKRLEKEQEALIKQQVELKDFDEKLRHYADKRIALDLDDGVKVNYGRFGDLLAEVKTVHGKKAAES